MKFFRHSNSDGPAAPARLSAFTLAEMLIATGLFSLVVVGGIYANILGLKMSALTQSKLLATHNGRAALNAVGDEIRSGNLCDIGTGDGASFSVVLSNNVRQGNAIQIYPLKDNTNTYVRYYLDNADQTLKRIASGGQRPVVIANFITNQIVFRAEDFAGTALTNNQNNRVIRMTLDFYQWVFAPSVGGVNGFYDYYRLQTRVARRARQ